jgi:NitT/TauT family transport system ATP-binding protein
MDQTTTQASGGGSPDAAAMLEVRSVRKVYEGRGRSVEAVRDLTFSVGQGELVCVVGPSGAGKTTLLKCIAGLLPPTSGEVVLEGARVSGPPPGMAVVFQEYGRSLFPWMTVRQNVELPLKEKKMPRARREELMSESLSAVDLQDVHDAYPWQLSGGMQQRVAIARAVAYEPHVLLMDEPFAAVDAQTRADLEDLIRSLWKRLGVTIVFVTHDIDEAVYLGERVLVLSSSPTVVMEDLAIDLPAKRDQLDTRSAPRFAELRGHVYWMIQQAKAGWRPDDGAPRGSVPAGAAGVASGARWSGPGDRSGASGAGDR